MKADQTSDLDFNLPLTDRDKGMPAGMAPIRLEEIGSMNWNVLREDLPLPVALLKQEALEHNSAWMNAFLADSGARISPHGKTTMSPQLFDLQLKDGAWAITVSTPHQIQVSRAAGIQRIVLANQLIGRKSIEFVLDELARDPNFEFYCLVDSVDLVRKMTQVARERNIGRPLQVLLEGGYEGGRTGCRTLEQAMATARAVHEAGPYLSLSGIEGFEGMIFRETPADSIASVQCFLQFLVQIANECAAQGLFSSDLVVMSAGGSIYYDVVTREFAALRLDRPSMTLTRSGCYLTHDSVMYARAEQWFNERNPAVASKGPGLKAAIEVWAYVQSRPEPNLVIVTMGKRDATPDHLPKLLKWFRPASAMSQPEVMPQGLEHRIIDMNDQHARLAVSESSPLRVGDMLCFGIGHPCLTFDKWRVMTVVNERYDIVSAIRTYF